MELVKLSLGMMGTNCYIVWDEKSLEAAVIDPGFKDDRIFKCIQENHLNVKYILLTHGHFDHLGGVDDVKEKTGAKIMIEANDEDCLTDQSRNLSVIAGMNLQVSKADGLLKEDESLFLGDMEIKVIYTPGHSKGGVCFLIGDTLIAGDTLFRASIGRTDFVDGDLNELLDNIREKLFILEDHTKVLPGHGENTTIGYERLNNPFLTGRDW